MTWRDRFRPIIAAVISEARREGLDLKETRRRLRAAFPCGIRKYHPYKVWLSECGIQLGTRPPLKKPGEKPPLPPDPRQQSLDFE